MARRPSLADLRVDPGLDRADHEEAIIGAIIWCTDRLDRLHELEAELYAIRLQAYETARAIAPPIPYETLAGAARLSKIAVSQAMRKAARHRSETT